MYKCYSFVLFFIFFSRISSAAFAPSIHNTLLEQTKENLQNLYEKQAATSVYDKQGILQLFIQDQITNLVQLIEKEEENEYAFILLAHYLWFLGEQTKAQEVLLEATTRNPNSALLWLMFAEFELEKKHINDAKTLFSKVLFLNPKQTSALNNLVYLNVYKSGLPPAKKQLEKWLKSIQFAIELDPKQAAFWDTLSEIYLAKKNKGLALVALKKAQALDPKNSDYQLKIKDFK